MSYDTTCRRGELERAIQNARTLAWKGDFRACDNALAYARELARELEKSTKCEPAVRIGQGDYEKTWPSA